MKKLIIIPTYNESLNIEKIVRELLCKIFLSDEIYILVVDDNSPDGTANIVKSLQKEFQNLNLLERNKKDGLGSAYKEGFKWGIEHSFDVMIQLDADFQHPIETLPEMLDKINENDVVIGSRYIEGGNWDYCQNKITLQKIISKAGRLYISNLLGCPINDMTGGFNIWKTDVIKNINLDTISAQGYAFQFEMKYNAYKKGFKILEYPIKFQKRIYGKSKMSLKIIIEALEMVWKLKKNN
ncbi:polyprenol monophosphomannose synthase [bacterium]|nr:polyprenol monophosphomannose synthase [bacterium]